jgi:hypothetical protein
MNTPDESTQPIVIRRGRGRPPKPDKKVYIPAPPRQRATLDGEGDFMCKECNQTFPLQQSHVRTTRKGEKATTHHCIVCERSRVKARVALYRTRRTTTSDVTPPTTQPDSSPHRD